MKIWIVLAGLALFGLFACAPQPSAFDEGNFMAYLKSCDSDLTCAIAAAAADDMNRNKGEPVGDSVIFLEASSQGRTLITYNQVPLVLEAMLELDPEVFKAMTRNFICDGGKDLNTYFDLGGRIQVVYQSSSGKTVLKQTVKSCP